MVNAENINASKTSVKEVPQIEERISSTLDLVMEKGLILSAVKQP